MTAKSLLQNHLNLPDTSNGCFWMAWEEFLLDPCLAAGWLVGVGHVENSAQPTQLLRQNPDVQPT
jgi:hypothetical protein